MKFQLVATCLFGLEHLLGEEIDALGYERVNTIDGRVTFIGDEEAIALSNIFLRYAERVFIKLGSFRAESFTELFDGVYSLPWGNFIGKSDAFPVKGHSIKSALFSIPDCQAITKKAIVKKLSEKYGIKDEKSGIRGIDFSLGATGMISLGNGEFLFSKTFGDASGCGTTVEHYKFDNKNNFEKI